MTSCQNDYYHVNVMLCPDICEERLTCWKLILLMNKFTSMVVTELLTVDLKPYSLPTDTLQPVSSPINDTLQRTMQAGKILVCRRDVDLS